MANIKSNVPSDDYEIENYNDIKMAVNVKEGLK
jgi:hypothetical protein